MTPEQHMLQCYIRTLDQQQKFKAKVVYTLSCIRTLLTDPTSQTYITSLQKLVSHHELLLKLMEIHRENGVLELGSLFFLLFAREGVCGAEALGRFLDTVSGIGLREGELGEGFLANVRAILMYLKHQYQGGKQLCIKLLSNGSMKKQQVEILVDTLKEISWVTLEEGLQMSQIAVVPGQAVLGFVWRNCFKVTPNKNNIALIQKTMTKYLETNWPNQRVKYLCMNIAIACALGDQPSNLTISPQFLNTFLHNNPKPLYLKYSQQPTKSNMLTVLPSILHHYSIQSLCKAQQKQATSLKTLQKLFPQLLTSNPQLFKLVQGVVERQQIPLASLQKWKDIVPVRCIDIDGAIGRKILLEKMVKEKDNILASCFFVLEKMLGKVWTGEKWGNEEGLPALCLFILQFALKNKQQLFLRKIQLVIAQLIPDLLSLMTLTKSNPNYLLFLPIFLPSLPSPTSQHWEPLTKQLDSYLISEQPHLSYKFYLAHQLIKWQYRAGVSKFVYFLMRKLGNQHLPYEEIAYYLRKCQWDKKDIGWLEENFQEELERILEKVFVRLVEPYFHAPKLIIFALEKHEIFTHWSTIYRWMLNPLDEPQFNNPQALIDSLQVFETVIQRCKNIPIELIKKFFSIVAKNWEHYNHHHMFTIERIAGILFSEQFTAENLQNVSHHLKNLTDRPWKSSNPELYRLSLTILMKRSLMQQTYTLEQSCFNLLTTNICSLAIQKQTFKNYPKLKQTLFCLQLLLWLRQYEQQPIDNKICTTLIKLLNFSQQLQITNQKDKQQLVQSILQIASSVPHNSNLLQLQISPMVRRYPSNKNIINFTIDTICSVKDSNLKAIGKYKMEGVIGLILCSLVTGAEGDLEEVWVGLVDELCQDKESPYYMGMDRWGEIFVEIIRAEAICIGSLYREKVVFFAMDWIQCLGIEKQVPHEWVKLIWLKYYGNQGLRELCEGMVGELKERKKCMEVRKNVIKTEEMKKVQEVVTKKVEKQKEQLKNTTVTKLLQKSVTPKVQNNQISSPITTQQPKQQQTKGPELKKLQIQQLVSPRKDQPPNLMPQPTFPKNSQRKNQPQLPKNIRPNPLSSSPSPKKKRTPLNQQQTQYMNSIKGHISYIESLSGTKASPEQVQKLKQSFHYLGDVAGIHAYYCQKIVNLGVVGKILALHGDVQGELVDEILEVFEIVSQNKEKNLVIFGDMDSANFFKKQLKASLNAKQELPQTVQIINIMKNCWNSSAEFFNSGLLSMLFQMCKQSLNLQHTLHLLSSCELSYQIVNEIYQRGLFTKMQQTFALEPPSSLTQKSKIQICLWAKLMGKVCLNQSIREKLYSIQLHVVTWGKRGIFGEMGCVENLAYLYSSFCYEFQRIAVWCVQEKIPEYFLAHVEAYPDIIPLQFYKFFRYFAQNGIQFISHLFRIKLQNHLLSILPHLSDRVKHQGYKHYYKCLAHMFVPEYYEYFIKAQLVQMLVEKYQEEHSFYILECLEKLVAQLTDKKEVDMLVKQKFFTLNRYTIRVIVYIFNTKVKDDLGYPHLLQAYTTLFRKFKKFDTKYITLDLANKIIKKAIFSINMQGKKKSIQFLISFSQVDKAYYGNANCSRIFQLLLGYNAGDEEFELMERYLEVEARYQTAVRDTEQARAEEEERYPLRFRKIVEIGCEGLLEGLCDKFIELKKTAQTITSEAGQKPRKSMQKILKILKYFNKNQANAAKIYEKIGGLLLRTSNQVCSYEESLAILNQLLIWKPNQAKFQTQQGNALQYLETVSKQIAKSTPPNKTLSEQYATLIQKCLKNNLIPHSKLQTVSSSTGLQSPTASSQSLPSVQKLAQSHAPTPLLSPSQKATLKTGTKVHMYKPDGSNSSLILFCTDDMFELHCVAALGEPVKNKWRLPLVEIAEIREFKDQEGFKMSVFYLAEGIFSKAPNMACCLALIGKGNSFYVCFDTPGQLKEWKQLIGAAREHALATLRKIS